MSRERFGMIAPFWSDVDTYPLFPEDVSGGMITYAGEDAYADPADGGNLHRAFGVHWTGVDYEYRGNEGHVSASDTFSLYLVDRSETGVGNFDIVFVYGALVWDTGDSGGGSGGHVHAGSGSPARAGWTNGYGATYAGTYMELAGSGVGDALIHEGANSLEGTVYSKEVRNPRAHLTVQDMASGATYTNQDKGVVGVVEDAAGAATLRLSLANESGVLAGDVYWYEVLAVGGGVQVPQVLDPAGDVRLALAAGGVATYTTSSPGEYEILVMNSGYSESVKFYVARLDIKWNGDELAYWNPNDSTYNTEDDAQVVHRFQNINGRSTDPINLYAGQHIMLSCTCDLSGIPRKAVWGFGGANDAALYFGKFDVSGDQRTGHVVPLSASDRITPFFAAYRADDAHNQVVTVKMKIITGTGDIVTFVNGTTFNFHKPGRSVWYGRKEGTPVQEPDLFEVYVNVRRPYIHPELHWLTGQADWHTNIPSTDYVGQTSYVQLTEAYATLGTLNNRLDYRLDTDYPYDHVRGSPSDYDYPHSGYSFLMVYQEIEFRFHDWLMWTPPGTGSIPVPIQAWDWSTEARAWWNSGSQEWDIAPAPSLYPASLTTFLGWNTDAYPKWTKKVG